MEDEIESPPKRRFVETTESERQDLLDSAKRKKTLISTQTWVNAFGAYCGPSTVDFHAISASDLRDSFTLACGRRTEVSTNVPA